MSGAEHVNNFCRTTLRWKIGAGWILFSLGGHGNLLQPGNLSHDDHSCTATPAYFELAGFLLQQL